MWNEMTVMISSLTARAEAYYAGIVIFQIVLKETFSSEVPSHNVSFHSKIVDLLKCYSIIRFV